MQSENKTLYAKALNQSKSKPTSMKFAIKAHCLGCIGAEQAVNAVDEIRNCPVLTCELRNHRPYK